MPVTISGARFTQSWEKCRLSSYQDDRGIWTVGWGCTGLGIGPDTVWTQTQADGELRARLNDCANHVGLYAGGSTTWQLDAMTDLAFNIGINAFKTSSVLKYHRARDCESAAGMFVLWDKEHVDGQLVESPGLKDRRLGEKDIYLHGVYRNHD
jgi:lysozyme